MWRRALPSAMRLFAGSLHGISWRARQPVYSLLRTVCGRPGHSLAQTNLGIKRRLTLVIQLTTSAQSRSTPSCAGVSGISRDTCKASAGTLTSINRAAFVQHHPGQHIEVGSGPGIRTLNLAVNRSLQPVQKQRSEFAECRCVPPNVTVCRRRCCTE